MPITFEQPGPYDRAISEAYGSATALKDFAPYLNRVYGGGGGGGGRSGGGGGGGRSGGGGGDGGGGRAGGGGGDSGFQAITSPLDLYQGKLAIDQQEAENERRRRIDWIRANTLPDTTKQQAQITALQDQRNQSIDATYTDAENQAWYNNEEPPQTDIYGSPASLGGPQTVQQVQANQRANVPEGQAQPQAPPEFTQADSLQLQRLQAGMSRVRQDAMNGDIDPGTARRMIAQIQTGIDPLKMAQQAAQTSMMQQQNQQMMDQNARMTAMRNMDATQIAQHVREHTTDLGNGNSIYTDPMVKTHIIRNERAAQQAENAHQVAQHDQHEDDSFIKALEHIEKTVLGAGAPGGAPPAPTDEQKARIRDMMRQRGFFSHNLGEHREIRRSLREDRSMEGRPEAQWTGSQRAQMESFQNRREAIQAAAGAPDAQGRPSPGGQAWAQNQTAEVNRAQSLFRTYGSPHKMPSHILKEYLRTLEQVDRQMQANWPGAASQNNVPQTSQAPLRQRMQDPNYVSPVNSALNEFGERARSLMPGASSFVPPSTGGGF